jgi:hypothetical protein
MKLQKIIQRSLFFYWYWPLFYVDGDFRLADLYYRVFNVLFVFYGTNRTLKMNYKEGKTYFASNAVSAFYFYNRGVTKYSRINCK